MCKMDEARLLNHQTYYRPYILNGKIYVNFSPNHHDPTGFIKYSRVEDVHIEDARANTQDVEILKGITKN